MGQLLEKTWKPVDVKSTHLNEGATAVRSLSTQMAWYDKLMINSGSRKQKLHRYDQMDQTVDINRALDIIAEDIASENADDDEVFTYDLVETDKPNSSLTKTITTTLTQWERMTEFDYRLFDFMREAVKTGVVMFRVNKDGSLKKLIQERIEGYKIDKNDDTVVTHYIYNNSAPYQNENGDVITILNAQNEEKRELLKVDDLMIIKIGEGPFGESMLDKIYRVWKQLQLLEDAVVIYRIVRAPERRVFYIDIGKLPAHKAEAHLSKVKGRLRQKQIQRNGEVETDYNPASMQEDYFLAQSGEGRGSRVETLPGGDNLGRIEDLMYFNKKLALGLRIPPSYLDSYSDNQEGGTFNDGRVGTAYIAEQRYVGFVKRVQKGISKSIVKNFRKFAKKMGVELPDDFELAIAPPQSFAAYKENELFSVLLNTYASAEQMTAISKREALKKFMRYDIEELTENEDAVLMEKGMSEKEIKALKDEERFNIVYGEGSVPGEEEDEFGGDGFGGGDGGFGQHSAEPNADGEAAPAGGGNQEVTLKVVQEPQKPTKPK